MGAYKVRSGSEAGNARAWGRRVSTDIWYTGTEGQDGARAAFVALFVSFVAVTICFEQLHSFIKEEGNLHINDSVRYRSLYQFCAFPVLLRCRTLNFLPLH